jgi:hypothetical protein
VTPDPMGNGAPWQPAGREARRAIASRSSPREVEALIKIVLNWVADCAPRPMAIVTLPGNPPALTVAIVDQDPDGRLRCQCPDGASGEPCWHTVAVAHTVAIVDLITHHEEEHHDEPARD